MIQHWPKKGQYRRAGIITRGGTAKGLKTRDCREHLSTNLFMEAQHSMNEVMFSGEFPRFFLIIILVLYFLDFSVQTFPPRKDVEVS